MVARAATAIANGQATNVLCVNGDTWDPKGMYLKPPPLFSPMRDFTMPYGAAGANADYAMAARLHMHRYGTTSRQLAKIAVDQRGHPRRYVDPFIDGRGIQSGLLDADAHEQQGQDAEHDPADLSGDPRVDAASNT